MRRKFNRAAIASSDGAYVRNAHRRYLKEEHEKFLTIEIHVPKRYFVKCFGKLIQVTEREAMMLGRAKIKIL